MNQTSKQPSKQQLLERRPRVCYWSWTTKSWKIVVYCLVVHAFEFGLNYGFVRRQRRRCYYYDDGGGDDDGDGNSCSLALVGSNFGSAPHY